MTNELKSCPICEKEDKVFVIAELYELPNNEGRVFSFICERCRTFFDKTRSVRTY